MPARDRKPLSPRLQRLRAAARVSATEHLGPKAAALFFALVLWVVVSAEEPAEDIVPVRFAPVVDSALVLTDSPTVRALVAGRGRELLKLYRTPPVVHRTFGPGTPELVRVQIRPTDVELPNGVDARVRDVQPREVTLRFAANPRLPFEVPPPAPLEPPAPTLRVPTPDSVAAVPRPANPLMAGSPAAKAPAAKAPAAKAPAAKAPAPKSRAPKTRAPKTRAPKTPAADSRTADSRTADSREASAADWSAPGTSASRARARAPADTTP